MNYTVEGNIVDVVSRKIFKGLLEVSNGKIVSIREDDTIHSDNYILPGLIDSHIHIESSMLVPSEFARAAVINGTIATVSDPHEIANVLGLDGIKFMLENGELVPFKFFFGAPSCVPATPFESSGAVISAEDIEQLFSQYDLNYLSEMMNFPGVLYEVPEVIDKLNIAKKFGKKIDGHCPGLSGEQLEKYISAGITTDHECFSIAEAREKIQKGMKILIREGSAAKNFDELKQLIYESPDMVMLCSDDKHPDDLIDGHINILIKRALASGLDLFDVVSAATVNPILHYSLDCGLLRKGDNADFIVVNNLETFDILETYIDGIKVAENGNCLFAPVEFSPINKFFCEKLSPSDLQILDNGRKIRVIEAIEGELITNSIEVKPKVENGCIVSDIEQDVLKIVVQNRYVPAKPAVAFIKNIGLKQGALATSVAHDSHNIIAVGTNDADLAEAINLIIENKGGMAAVRGSEKSILPLEVAGIMSSASLEVVANKYLELNQLAKKYGSSMNAPFMTLSFMALLVIPKLKLSDKGLFDGEKFCFTELEI